jgi:hypothetical protein
MLALRGVERIRFAGRAEDGETIGAFSEQPATMRGKPVAVDAQVRLKGRQRGDEDATWKMIKADD